MENEHKEKMNKKQLQALKRMLRYRYGISYETYVDLYERQKGMCGICKEPTPLGGRKGLYIDHDHITNEVRGLLCPNCNSGIGKFKDSVTILQNAIDYLS